jgi:hypothetical protein
MTDSVFAFNGDVIPSAPPSDPVDFNYLGDDGAYLCKMSAVQFDGFLKLLDLYKNSSSINISNSVVSQYIISSIYAYSNIGALIPNLDFNIVIPTPDVMLKRLKPLRGSSVIYFKSDDDNKQFLVCNEKITIEMPYDTSVSSYDPPFDESEAVIIGNSIEVSESDGKLISSYASQAKHTYLLLDDNNQLSSIYFSGVAYFKFSDTDDLLSFDNSSVRLETVKILPIDGEMHTLKICSTGDQNDLKYWVRCVTKTKYGICVTVVENLSLYNAHSLI